MPMAPDWPEPCAMLKTHEQVSGLPIQMIWKQ
jgi:hypothetical protein